MEREVHAILGPLGVKEGLSRLIANDLREVEDAELEEQSKRSGGASSQSSKRSWWKWGKKEGGIKLTEEEEGGSQAADPGEMGLTPFLLKFGEGMGEFSFRSIRPYLDGVGSRVKPKRSEHRRHVLHRARICSGLYHGTRLRCHPHGTPTVP
jgi:hypothetical protein